MEIDKTDGFLLLFEVAQAAARFSEAVHAELSGIRIGLHQYRVLVRRNPQEHVARGAKPLEVEGVAKPILGQL